MVGVEFTVMRQDLDDEFLLMRAKGQVDWQLIAKFEVPGTARLIADALNNYDERVPQKYHGDDV